MTYLPFAPSDYSGSQRLFMACAVQRRRFPVGESPTRRNAPAGSNRSNYGGNEMVEAFGYGRLHSVTTGRFGGSKLLHQVTNIHSPDTHHHRQQHPARASAPSCSKPTSHHFRRYPLSRCNFATRVSSSATRFTSRTRETISSRTAERLWSGMPCRSSSIAISP